MITKKRTLIVAVLGVTLALVAQGPVAAQDVCRLIPPEQRCLAIRRPAQLPNARLPDAPTPPTVSEPQPDAQPWNLSLDEAIRIALANSEVIRVLAGASAASSGRTIYDPAIANTQIDQSRGRFDPSLQIQNNFNRHKQPQAYFDPSDPTQVLLGGTRTHDYDMATGLSKTTTTGGTANLGVAASPLHSSESGLPLNPNTRSTVELGITQPLLQGAGVGVNLAPIVISRIDTERSFFQMKDAVQQLVRGVIEGYWALVFARTDLWARQQQVDQSDWAYRRAEGKRLAKLGDASDVAQAHSALANFRVSLVGAKANALQREAALRNILGLPPSDGLRVVPVTPPLTERLAIEWADVLALAEEYRPDLIELKLVLEADQQRLLQANNQALPAVDASALYRWNGLEGRTPDRRILSSSPREFQGWQLGVNFAVPLGLRQSRAALRQQQLLIMRDRANLQQGLHGATHVLAANYRNLAQFYEQYQALKEARAAARYNLAAQSARFETELTLYLNVLQAITNWGNSVSAEAQTLVQYNSELANLEQQTGTILESHGVRFVEERFGAIGPMGRLFAGRCYPRDSLPGPNTDQYESTPEPAENVFGLDNPPVPGRGAPRPQAPLPPTPQSRTGPAAPSPAVERLQIEVPRPSGEPIPRPSPLR